MYKRDSQMNEKLSNLQQVYSSIQDYFAQVLNVQLEVDIDLESIVISKQPNEAIIKLFELVIGIVVNCPDKDFYIRRIIDLDEET